jgi:hypothetical protein
MNSIFKINKLRRKKLKEILKTLFPEYKYIFVKNNGVIIFRKYWFFTYKSIHISELSITEIPERLSNFRQGDKEYTPVYNQYLEYIIHYKIKNVIDYLYSEFLKVKKDSRLTILVENAKLLLPVATEYETIGSIITQEKQIKKRPIYYINSKKIRIIQNLYETLLKESIIDKFERAKYLIHQ